MDYREDLLRCMEALLIIVVMLLAGAPRRACATSAQDGLQRRGCGPESL